jgi:hypothetical protein
MAIHLHDSTHRDSIHPAKHRKIWLAGATNPEPSGVKMNPYR